MKKDELLDPEKARDFLKKVHEMGFLKAISSKSSGPRDIATLTDSQCVKFARHVFDFIVAHMGESQTLAEA